ncbi:ABC transporter ATP-binding protein [Pseudomonas sp. CFBP 8770]|uniref:ABC transporter ATP-binding protein n=1 Tax=unclassified Pseudomonas TaxID=196821 RepID=UPI00177F203B|nr:MULTISPECIES: ABC transporter ATP-binding protein [unclassified Pseudomonas]MBD8472866.1 ABC transporter ATP-binding protein [Pseudomonas sp. CFBP 8773]MBD8646031.1 ABC transporter ATP-binding protein [Pseudomonas sp. CFBP 8770]
MLNTFLRLLGNDTDVLYRYLGLTLLYGLLNGLTIVAVIPVLTGLLGHDITAATRGLVPMLVGVALCWALRRVVEKAGVRFGMAVLQAGRHRLSEHVARLPVGWFDPDNTARLSHVSTQGMMALAQLPAHVLTPLITSVITPLAVVAGLFLLNLQMALIALVTLPLLLAVFTLTARMGQRSDVQFHASTARASRRMVEFAQAQSVLRAFNGEDGGTRFLQQAIAGQQQSARQLIHVSAMSVVLNSWAVQVSFAALLAAAGWALHTSGGSMTPASMAALVVALMLVSRFIDPLLEVASYSEILRGARGQLAVVDELFAVQPLPLPIPPTAAEPADNSVAFHDVSFGYSADSPHLLEGISLHIPAGSMTAVVGASGSGKTTLVRLIARFFDVDQGSVQVGGVDVRQLSSTRLAALTSQIFQDAYLFQGSIAANIGVGRADASREQILQAAEQAGVLEIVARLPQGLDTQVGEGGARLSGGERQRIAIARALLKDAPILLIDEATSALDAENQAAIAQTLARLRGKRTLVVIAHQLSTVEMADQIVVLADGRIAEQGSHAQLSRQAGPYARFLAQRRAAKGWRLAAAAADEDAT